MIIGFTGFRPQKLELGFDTSSSSYSFLRSEIRKFLTELNPNKVITGMALGTDTLVAQICVELKIPFIAAVPFSGQELYWPKESRDIYFDLLTHADSIETINRGGFASWKMHARNVWIVDNSDMLLTVFDPTINSGGTFNTVSYAKEKKKKIIVINPKENYNEARN